MRWRKAIFISLGIIILGLPIAVFWAFILAYQERIYPQTRLSNIELGGLTKKKAKEIIDFEIKGYSEKTIILNYQENSWEIKLSELEFHPDLEKTIDSAFQSSRKKPLFKPKYLNLEFSFKEELLDQKLATIGAQIKEPMIPTQLTFNSKTKELGIIEGKLGLEIDFQASKVLILDKIGSLEIEQPIPLLIKELNHLPSEEEIKAARERGEKLVNKTITLISEYQNFILKEDQLINFVGFPSWWDEEKINQYLETISQSIDQNPQNALFKFEEGRITAFQPDRPGFKLNKEKAREIIIEALTKLVDDSTNVAKDLVLEKTEPEVKISDTNRLGIVDLIGKGESFFRGSIASRIHNINLASSRLNGVLINPGETFSLVQALGDISKETGYQDAYIIKEGRTVLGEGGGVCQVSTTLFRAVLNTGLPIIERHPHAYRVSYYEQDAKPGFDATVFSPNTDLKFKNNTQDHILIQREFEPKTYHLAFLFYGTPDGRKAEISNIRLWDVVPPPEDLYIDDPNLPSGTIKQIDFKSWGGKTAFDWKVIKNNEILQEKTFYSAYRPWQAIFLKGIKAE